MGFIPSKDHRMSFGEICKLESLDSIHWLRKCHTDKYLLLLLLSTYFNAYLKKWFHIKPWDSKSLFAKFKKWVRFKKKMNSLPTPDFYSLSALPPSQPWTCLGSAVGSDLPKRIWFPSLWLSRKWRWVLNMNKQEERGPLWWFSPIFERKFWKANFSPQPKNNNKLCTLKCYRQPSRDREDQPIWGWSQSWQWCGRDQKMLTIQGNKKPQKRDFPGGPAVNTLHFHCTGCGFNPWLGN